MFRSDLNLFDVCPGGSRKMKRVFQLILFEAKQVPRGYFAPIVGVWKGIQRECRKVDLIESIKRRSFFDNK